ncbi:MAG TPA: 16S rRNA (cytosine(967)-C(5))-methyltransferase RsmB [Nitrospiraceae bacterium]|nr:16S rRNA (cytosine(967)-C(5))-methyltransferase RsmB [Nitrospiraceae bacterium]
MTPRSRVSPKVSDHAAWPPGARSLALQALLMIEEREAFADEVLGRILGKVLPDARDRALTFELVYGVLRHRTALDWRLEHVADRPLQRLPSFVLNALRLGAYQLLFLSRVPPSAAVNETVALVKSTGKATASSDRDWTGFVNAILRALTRKPPPPEPDPRIDPVAAWSLRYSCPSWLTERWVGRFGAKAAGTLCRATAVIPPLTIRANTLRGSRESLADSLTKSGHAVSPTLLSPVGLTLEKSGPVSEFQQFTEGLFYVEDEAGQLAAPILAPQPGERVLDACAAPGGKATHLAALMENRGTIVALDRSPARLQLLKDNCQRLGIGIIEPVVADVTKDLTTVAQMREPFDCILLDAPCSGLGVLRRHPEGKWWKEAAQLETHQARQLLMLEQVSRLLRPGGRLVYSTCSTEPDENEDVIDQFCSRHAEFQREPASPWLPEAARDLLTARGEFSTLFNVHSMDAFFAARLRKADS